MWQVVKGEELSIEAKSQQSISSTLPAHRGAILAADSYPLASAVDGWLLWASIPQIKDGVVIAKQLAPVLSADPLPVEIPNASGSGQVKDATPEAQIKDDLIKQEEDRLTKLLTKKDVVWIALKKKISKSQKQSIENLHIDGLGFTLQEGREYPEGFMASHVLGFLGTDAGGSDKGYFGLEGFYNLTLQGTEGLKAYEKDAIGSPILLGENEQVTASNGLSLKTHIDRSVQFIIEQKLKEGIQKYQATGGTIIVMRPQDGAILGMASYPDFIPDQYTQFSNDKFIDPAVSLSFEPGSIFKPVIMSAALNEGVVKPDTQCLECTGPVHIDKYTIETGTKQYYPNETMTEIIQHSDNVGMVWVSKQLGMDKMYDYLQKFGFGNPTGIDLQGEASPILRKREQWGLIDQATASFGQGIAVTPIQMVRAISAIANGGRLPKPEVVDSLIGDSWQEKVKPDLSEQIISEDAARDMTDMMVHNVDTRDDWPKPKDIKIAGKTGTAQIPIAGHYDPDKTIHSFVGFAPAYAPKYVMLVTLKDPKNGQFASVTAAPLWFQISQQLLPYLGISPN